MAGAAVPSRRAGEGGGEGGERGAVAGVPLAPAWWLALAVACLAAGALTLRQVNDPDAFTHLSLGRTFLEAGSPFAPDPARGWAPVPAAPGEARGWLAGLASGPPEWPFQVALAALEARAGMEGVSVALAAVGAALAALLLVRARRLRDPRRLAAATGLAVAAVLAARFRLTPRPEAPAAVLLLVALGLASGWTRRPAWWRLAALAALFAGWRVLHPTWTLGALFAGAVLAGRPRLDSWRARPLPVRLAAAAVVALAAIEVGRFALLVLRGLGQGGVLAGVTEMQPAWGFPSVLWPFLGASGLALALALPGRAGRWWRLATWAGALVLGLVVVRNVALAALVQAFLALDGLDERTEAPGAGARLASLAAGPAVALALALGVLAARDRDPPLGAGVAWRWFPRDAAAFVASAGLAPTVFNSWDHGGYLGWAWRGRPPVFLDGRLEPRERLADHDALVDAAAPARVVEAYGLRTVLLEPLYRNSGRIVPAVGWLLAQPDWRLVRASDAVVFARTPLPPGVAPVPEADLFRALLARAELLETQAERPAHAPFTRAIAWLRLGEAGRAAAAWREGMEASPELAGVYPGLPEAILAAGGR